MNTADRSIALLDVALRRRFGFYELMPDYNLFEGVNIKGLPLQLWLTELNKRILEFVGKDARNLQIGHAYFLQNGKPIRDVHRLRRVIAEDIIPLLEEYCYGDYSTIAKIIGSRFVNINRQVLESTLLKKGNEADFITALIEPSPEIVTSASVHEEDPEENGEDTNDGSDGNGDPDQ